MDYLKKSRIEEVLIAILGKGTVTSQLISRIEKILDAIRTDGSYDGPVMSEVEEILVCILLGKRFEKPTHSRIAAMLKVKANGGEYTELRKSRVENLIFEWINAVEYVTYTGTLPATLQTVRGYLENYKIFGNTEQTGTPTPENPIMPSGCGELETTGAHAGQYKLPLTANGVEYPIYLGEVETTRKIRKLVLTGEERWEYESQYERFSTRIEGMHSVETRKTPIVCTHYPCIYDGRPVEAVPYNSAYIGASGQFASIFLVKTTGYTSVADFKAYLAAQYANGTPVTVWYILTEPETGIANEPLMKIDNYADTIDSTQTTVQIPTAAGTTVIDYDGTPKPEKVELTYSKPK